MPRTHIRFVFLLSLSLSFISLIPGKTSIGRSIAAALGRSFHRVAVGGLDDVSAIKGHRRSYMGALPGTIVRGLKVTQTANPVFMLDEIDKIATRGMRGDPAAALLEVLDPEQNDTFVDHFLDVPIDLSHVLFICTANSRDTIPGPLRDRMDFIHITGYTSEEKFQIARKYLIPKLHATTGVQVESLEIATTALLDLIRWYSREPGIRGIQKLLEKLFRKVALQMAKRQAAAKKANVTDASDASSTPIIIDENNLHEYVGQRRYTKDRMYETTPVGVVMGLGYSESVNDIHKTRARRGVRNHDAYINTSLT